MRQEEQDCTVSAFMFTQVMVVCVMGKGLLSVSLESQCLCLVEMSLLSLLVTRDTKPLLPRIGLPLTVLDLSVDCLLRMSGESGFGLYL